MRLLLKILGVSALCACSAPDPTVRARSDIPDGTVLVTLGTGTPNADSLRFGPALAVVTEGSPYLVDAGVGVVRRAALAGFRGVRGMTVTNLDIVFITHLHSDHTVGLADLIFSPWVLGRDRPLRVFGPPGISAMIDHLLAAYAEDIRIRLDGLEPANPNGYRVETVEVQPGVVYADDKVRVTAFHVTHGGWGDRAFGYRFDTTDRSIVVSGDAAPSESIVEACNGCDVLVHEVYSHTTFQRRAPEWQRYHAAAHTSTVQLADIANRAGARQLVLYHQLFWGATPDDLLAELTEAGFTRPASVANDLDVY